MTPALDVRHLRLDLNGFRILDDVSLRIGLGERWAVVGPNGAGKSTLLRCFARIHSDWKGRIALHGIDIQGYGNRELARIIAYVPQAGGRLPPFTVRETILMSRYPHLSHFGVMSSIDQRIVQDVLARLGIGPLAERTMNTLSGGERQKVFLAAALAQEAEILLLDEPTTFLDPRHAYEIRRLLGLLNQQEGKTLIEVTHGLNEAAMDCDRIIALKAGRTAFFGPPDRFMDEDALEDVFDRRFQLGTHPQTGLPVILPGRCDL